MPADVWTLVPRCGNRGFSLSTPRVGYRSHCSHFWRGLVYVYTWWRGEFLFPIPNPATRFTTPTFEWEQWEHGGCYH